MLCRGALQTYSVHSDSVWALAAADPSLTVVYSGGRDGALYRTHLPTRASELLVLEQVRAGLVWVAAYQGVGSCDTASCTVSMSNK